MNRADQIIFNFLTDILPFAIQFTMVLMAVAGLATIASTLVKAYGMISEGENQTREGMTFGGASMRIFLAGLMVVPSVFLWRTADLLIGRDTITNTNILGYMQSETMRTAAYCDRFVGVIHLLFFLTGLMAWWRAWSAADDQSKGLNPRGRSEASIYFIGGLFCMFIPDVAAIIGNSVGVDVGFQNICTVFIETSINPATPGD